MFEPHVSLESSVEESWEVAELLKIGAFVVLVVVAANILEELVLVVCHLAY